MTTLVIGASSQIGRFLLPRLAARGEPVLALSRQPRIARDGVQWALGELPDALPPLPVLDAIVSFGPLDRLAAWLARAEVAGAPRVVATSSMSAQSKRESPVLAERALARRLCDGEAALAAACRQSGSAWTVLRPTLIYGAGLDRSLTPIARRALRTRVFPLPAGRGLRQPVHAEDIALAVLAALDRIDSAQKVIEIGGGERLRAGAMFARVRHSLPRMTMPVPLPAPLLRLAARMLPRWRGPLHRLDEDLVADNAELQRVLGVCPRAFQPDTGCWSAAE